MNIIKKGYRVSVTSWENDAHNYQTVILDGLFEIDVKLIIAVCNVVKTNDSGCQDESHIGNLYNPNSEEFNLYHRVLQKVCDSVMHPYFTDSDNLSDFLGELGLIGSDFFTRVAESIKIEWIPEDIVIEDVTSKFI